MSKKKNNGVQLKTFKLSELNPAPYNPRKISDESLHGLTKSLERFGCVEPIIVNVRGGKNVIVGGHQRHKALTGMGEASVECVVVDLSPEDEKLLNLSLNNPQIQGEFIDDITAYINELRSEISEEDAIDLRINELSGGITEGEPNEPKISEQFNVLCECDGESEQKQVYELLTSKGYSCRLLTL